MLNRNKIDSLINGGDSNPSIVSRGTKINYQTLKSKLKSGSWTPDDIESLADYFKKPMTYFFDKEEKSYNPIEPELDVASEPGECKNPECISKLLRLYKDLDEAQKKIIQLQGEQLNDKKETSVADSAQYGQAAKHGKTG